MLGPVVAPDRIPRPRVPEEEPAAPPATRGVVRAWMVRAWQCFLRLAVYADPQITSIWVHGHFIDLSIYDPAGPEKQQ
jgi:hypothetical protein